MGHISRASGTPTPEHASGAGYIERAITNTGQATGGNPEPNKRTRTRRDQKGVEELRRGGVLCLEETEQALPGEAAQVLVGVQEEGVEVPVEVAVIAPEPAPVESVYVQIVVPGYNIKQAIRATI